MNDKQGFYPDNVFFTWDIQYQCNYRCTYCFLHYEKSTASIPTVHLDADAWFAIWKDIHNRYGPAQIQITGGEPFAYSDFMDLISKLSPLHSLSFSTNLFWDVNEFMRKVPADRVKVDASYHPEFTDLAPFLEKVAALKGNGYFVSVTVVAYPPMFEKIKLHGRAFKEKGVDFILYPYRGPFDGRFYPAGYTEEERIRLGELGLKIGAGVSRSLKEQHFSIQEMVQPRPYVGERYDASRDKSISPKLCRMGKMYAKIVPNGDAYRCCSCVWDETKPWINWGYLGNLAQGTFKLLDQEGQCYFWQNCICYKAMVIGEEQKWVKDWNTVGQIRDNQVVTEELSSAKRLRDEGRFDQAIAKLRWILGTRPREVKAITLLGEIFVDTGRTDETIQVVGEGIANNLDPNNFSWLYRVLGKAYAKQISGDSDAPAQKRYAEEALAQFFKAVQYAKEYNNPIDESQAYYEIANVHSQLGDFENALSSITRAMGLDPCNSFLTGKKEAWEAAKDLLVVKTLRDAKQLKEAKKEMGIFLAKRPRHIQALALLAEIHSEEFDHEDAEQAIARGIDYNNDADNFSWLYLTMGKVLSRRASRTEDTRQREEFIGRAFGYLSQAVESARNHRNTVDESQGDYELAYLYYMRGDKEKTESCIKSIPQRREVFFSDESKEEAFREAVKKTLGGKP